MNFTFIHAADLHIDSPFGALGRKNAGAAALFAQASRRAVEALVAETLASKAAFLIIAGDVFDGDWADMSSGLFFVRELAKLERADVPVFMLRGNHDAEGRVTKSLTWPANVREFSTRKAQSLALEELRTVLHGRGFADRRVDDDFVAAYPARREGWLNIGVLHTALDGTRGHASYAPCTEADLRRFGYDYWALGHIHAAEIVSRDPWIVFPGNIQGRSVRETGAKGAMRVTVADGRIIKVDPIVLDAARWAHETIDVSACDSAARVLDEIHARLAAVHESASGKPIAARITLTGTSPVHAALIAGHEQLVAEAQAIASRVAEDCWLEKLRVETSHAGPSRVVEDLEIKSFDIEGLLREADDPQFAQAIISLAGDIRAKLPRELQDDGETALPASAVDAEAIGARAQSYILGLLAQGPRE